MNALTFLAANPGISTDELKHKFGSDIAEDLVKWSMLGLVEPFKSGWIISVKGLDLVTQELLA